MTEYARGARAPPARTLRRIAVALGRAETAFLDGSGAAADLMDASELLRIWDALPDVVGRRKVLSFARAVLA